MLAISRCIMFMMADSGAAVLAARFVQGLSAGFGMSAVSAPRHRLRGGEASRLGIHRGQLRRHGGHHDRVGGRGHPLRHRAEHRRALRHHDRHPGRVPVPHARGARAPRPDALAARRHEGARLHPHRQPGVCSPWWPCATWPPGSSPASTSRSRAPIAQQCFGETSPLAGSVILALIMAPSLLGGPLVQRFEPKRTLVVSMAAVTATTALMALFVLMGAELLFMADCACSASPWAWRCPCRCAFCFCA